MPIKTMNNRLLGGYHRLGRLYHRLLTLYHRLSALYHRLATKTVKNVQYSNFIDINLLV
ncbi:hypothetical protein [Sporosarcina thermotolerans]|uniref:hypothetical protein n=1 Tax=Sporosarcina thermotolerans TaxID=633404 RepID=UPI0036D33EDD